MTSMMLIAGTMWGIAAPGPKEEPKKAASQSPIVGEWILDSATAGGMAVPQVDMKFEFTKEGKMIQTRKGKRDREEQAYTVNEKKDPFEIDWVIRKNEGTILGIWKVDGDTLTLCFTDGYDGKRPSKFESLAGSKELLFKFKRAPKKD